MPALDLAAREEAPPQATMGMKRRKSVLKKHERTRPAELGL